jgi:hypothetical protein
LSQFAISIAITVTPEEERAKKEQHVAGVAVVKERKDTADDAEHDVGPVRVLELWLPQQGGIIGAVAALPQTAETDFDLPEG